MASRIGRIAFCLFSFLTVFTGIGAARAQSEQIGTVSSPLSVSKERLWPSHQISVCWENPGADGTERQWVRDAVGRTWETASAVRFVGWEQCAGDSRGIRILIADAWPHTEGLGTTLDGLANGMVLNFTFAAIFNDACGGERRQFCIEAIAAHEFGHALGIAHEHNRSDRLPCDEDIQGSVGDLNVTPYDLASIMNYCNPAWNGDGNLSDLDRVGVSILYGKGGTPVPGSGAAVAYYDARGSQQLETLFVDPNGGLSLVWKANNSFWKGPVGLSGPNLLPRDGYIALVRYPLGNQFEALYAGIDGAIYVTFKADNSAWSDPIPLTPPQTTRPGAVIGLAYYPPNNQFEALFIGQNGALQVLWKAQNEAWQGPVGLSGPDIAPPGAGIATVYYPLNEQLETMFIGHDGAFNLAWKVQNGAWNPPIAITPPFAPPGALIAAQFYPPNNQLESWVIDNEGALNVIWKAQNGPWFQPARLTGPGFGLPGGAVAASNYINNQLELMTVDSAGAVSLLWKVDNGAWQGPVGMTGPGHAVPGSPISMAYQPLNNQLETFFSDWGGDLNLIWKENNGPWSGAFKL